MNTCSKCGAVGNGRFCPRCGSPMAAAPAPSNPGYFSAGGGLGGPAAPVNPIPPVPPVNPAVPPYGAVPPVPPAPAAPAAAAPRKTGRRISPGKELRLLLRQGVLILMGEKRNLIISLLFPFIAALITVWIAGEEMFVSFESTKSACFILVCAAIWGGLFNSIQSLVKERDNIKRDYVSGALRIECYMGSRAIIQVVLCAFQSLVLTMSIPAVNWVYGNSLPDSGVIFGDLVFLEFYLSIFLIMFTSDTLGLLISSIVKKEELASKLAPYILIAQLLFSGVLFKLEGGAKTLSSIMISRWGMEALGSICDLNGQETRIYRQLVKEEVAHIEECPMVKQGVSEFCQCANGVVEGLKLPGNDEMFEATSEHMLIVLLIMVAFVVVPLIAADIMLHRVKKDGRD